MNLASPSNIERTLWTRVAATLAAVLWLAKSDRATVMVSPAVHE